MGRRNEDKYMVVVIYDRYEQSTEFFATRLAAIEYAQNQTYETHMGKLLPVPMSKVK